MVYQYEETKIIRAYGVDFNNRIKISSVFNLLQDIASVHADKLRLGYKDLNDLDLSWVLSWAKLQMEHYPGLVDSVVIKTWPKCKNKLYSIRDYSARSEDGGVLFNATSTWLPLNKLTTCENIYILW